MTDIPEWTTNSRERGYDHPIDRMHISAGMNIVPGVPGTTPLFSVEQGYKAAERLFLPEAYRDDVVAAMARVALNRFNDSDRWEALNLTTMASLSEAPARVVEEYGYFAGNPDRVAGFIDWFAHTTESLPERPAGSYIVGHEGRLFEGELITDEEPGDSVLKSSRPQINGYTLTIGIANQIEGYSRTYPLDMAYNKGLREVTQPPYGFEVEVLKSGNSPRRHRVELVELGDKGWQTDEGDIILHITRERGAVNYRRNTEHGPQILFGVKRFDSLVALRGIELVRGMMDVLASERGTIVDDKRSPELAHVMQKFETIIRQQGKSRSQNSVRVVPLLTSQIIRDPKK